MSPAGTTDSRAAREGEVPSEARAIYSRPNFPLETTTTTLSPESVDVEPSEKARRDDEKDADGAETLHISSREKRAPFNFLFIIRDIGRVAENIACDPKSDRLAAREVAANFSRA